MAKPLNVIVVPVSLDGLRLASDNIRLQEDMHCFKTASQGFKQTTA